MIQRIAVVILILGMLTVMTGCWGKTELNEIGIVTSTGIDLEPDGKIRVTVLSEQPSGSLNTPNINSSTWIGSAVGSDLIDAAKNLRTVATKRLTWLHNKVIIIGQNIARSKMKEIIDYLSRDRQIRFNSHILVAEGRAFDLLQSPSDIQKNLTDEILGTIRNTDEWSRVYVANVKELLVSNADDWGNLVTGRIWYKEDPMVTFSAPRQEHEKFTLKGENLPIVYMEGCAVFKDGSMVGWLDADQTKGYLWISGKLMPGLVITMGGNRSLAMQDSSSSSSVKMKVDGENITAVIKVDVRGNLVEQTDNENIGKEQTLLKIEDEFAAIIKNDMDNVVKKVQKEYNADIFNFGSTLNKQHPSVWKKVQKDWENTGFSKIKIQYRINVTIERTGKVLKEIS